MKKMQRQGCGCYQERHNRWIEPSILYLLHEKKKHGYELMTELPELGFIGKTVDPGAIYRTLRHLEQAGLVFSQWDTTGSGPAKRVYTLSDLGRNHLNRWADALEKRRNSLDAFLAKLETILQKKEDKP
jgi:poly-beta-hydroxybutyrate-responsive repressor